MEPEAWALDGTERHFLGFPLPNPQWVFRAASPVGQLGLGSADAGSAFPSLGVPGPGRHKIHLEQNLNSNNPAVLSCFLFSIFLLAASCFPSSTSAGDRPISNSVGWCCTSAHHAA
jgi:hypothetical protein